MTRRATTRSSSGGAPAIAFGLVLVLALLRLFVPGPIGRSDQGDLHRTTCQLGVRVVEPTWGSRADHVEFRYVPHRWYGEGCGANGTGQAYRSSEVVLLRLGALVTGASGRPGLDLRAVGVVDAVLLAAGSAAVAWCAPGRRRRRVVLGVVLGVVLLDHGVAGLLASAYSEPAALLGLLGVTAGMLAVLRRPVASPAALTAVAGAGAFVLLAKSQLATLLPLVVLALLVRPVGLGRRRTRVPGAVLAVALTILVGWYLSHQPARFAEINRHDRLFGTLLVLGHQPAEDLRWFGLDPALAPAVGHSIADRPDITGSVAYEAVGQVSDLDLVRFAVAHPGRLVALTGRGMDAAATYELDGYVSSYPADAGRGPGALEHRFGPVALVFALARGVPIVLPVVLGATVVTAASLVRRCPGEPAAALAAAGGWMAGAAFIQFWTALLGDGLVELVRHLQVADITLVWAVVLVAAAVVEARATPPA